ncbi:unnamed protein product [Anisakis simplex]|uniref:Uncharacterized protein n=1 Tax=Anisakis simplex TaxID=6269 RepID=A0A0M3K308_ANISI|nr:unnamed protein product [Anisakis simplex]
MDSTSPTQNDDEYFFGENYRSCGGWLHVVCAARLVIALDVIICLVFLLVLPLKFGYLDALCIVQLCVTTIVIVCALIDCFREGHSNLLWPFISYKCIEVIAASIMLIVIGVLVVCGNTSRSALIKLLRYRFRNVSKINKNKRPEGNWISESNELMYISLSVIALCAQLAFSCIAAHTFISVHRYFNDKAIRKYIDERKDLIKYFL